MPCYSNAQQVQSRIYKLVVFGLAGSRKRSMEWMGDVSGSSVLAIYVRL